MKSGKITLEKSGPNKAPKTSYKLSVLFFENSEGWSAQCLEYDIATQAPTLGQLYHEVERILVAHVILADELAKEPFKGYNRAPRKYWSLFEKSQLRFQKPKRESGKNMPPIQHEIRVAQQNVA